MNEIEDYFQEYKEADELWQEYMAGCIPHFVSPAFGRLPIFVESVKSVEIRKEYSKTGKPIKGITHEQRNFLEKSRELGINANDIFLETGVKRGLLTILGYRSLQGPKTLENPSGKILLGNCDEERIGRTYQNCYNSYAKREF